MSTITVEPGQNIQNAINTANSGDTVFVKDGIFKPTQKIVVNESIQFLAQSKNTIIDGTLVPYPGSSWERGLIEIISNNVRMAGFTVQNSRAAGILSINASNLIIELNKTYKTWSSGIQIHDGQNLKILHNEIDKPATPDIWRHVQENLSIASPRNNMNGFEIAFNYIHGGNIADDGALIRYNGGIYCKQGCKNGSIHHNYIANIRYGAGTIYIDSWDLVNRNIDVYKNLLEVAGSIGITTETGGTCDNITVRENIVTRCARGIVTPNTSRTGTISNLLIKDNIVYKNGYPEFPTFSRGIWLGRTPFAILPTYSNVRIENNIVCNNGNDPQIVVDPRIPTSAYTLLNNKTALDYISQSQFDILRNRLYNEIYGGCAIPQSSMRIF